MSTATLPKRYFLKSNVEDIASFNHYRDALEAINELYITGVIPANELAFYIFVGTSWESLDVDPIAIFPHSEKAQR